SNLYLIERKRAIAQGARVEILTTGDSTIWDATSFPWFAKSS
ncbi:3224_t:CDS:1, partial [Acaulospora colombiana]